MQTDRYHRQVLLPQIGCEGQARLGASRVLLVGCGALGGVIAEQLARAGVGMLRIADRDIVEVTNLQRQVLFDEQDAAEQAAKAVAAARRLREINSQITIEPVVADVNPQNVERLAGLERGGPALSLSNGPKVDLILDGTDNVETRYLLNDVSVKHGVPWIYGACVGTEGRCMAIDSPRTACLRCLFPQPPGPGELQTCDTAGVLAPAAATIACLQATLAIQLLLGTETSPWMTTLDIWSGRFHRISLEDAKVPDCIACSQRRFEFLDNISIGRSTSLCGRNSVQVRPMGNVQLSLESLSLKLAAVGQVERTPYLVRCFLREPRDVSLTVFPDGRAIVHGVSESERARSLYARFVGM